MTAQEIVALRRAGPEDATLAAQLVHNLLRELADGKEPSLQNLTATTQFLLDRELVLAVIAFSGKSPIGIICLNECAAIYAGGRFGEITELYVAPEYRSMRIAPKLIEEAQLIGLQRGWTRLEVGAPDQPAWNRTLAFYLREGFVEVGPRLKLKLRARSQLSEKAHA